MRKVNAILMIALLCGMLAASVLAAPEEPVITMQPQNPNYPEYSVAIYTVKATGTNLTATWYIQYQGKTYNAAKIGGAMQPWEAYAGEAYGARKLDENTFCFVFEGIEEGLSGAQIWCEIEDGHYDTVSQAAHITVGNYGSPPEILHIPASVTVKQGEDAELRCVARSTDGSQLNFLWYETGTGRLEDIQAIDRGAETGDYMLCDTRTAGTRYYVCGITTSDGGMAYSSVVEVNVVADTANAAAPRLQNEALPNAVVGTQYAVQLKCTDPKAEFFPYDAPGTQNDLTEGSWLSLSTDGWLMGTPTRAGTYHFGICAVGAGGEGYGVYTITVEEPAQPPAAAQTAEPVPEPQHATAPTAEPTSQTEQSEGTIPWWVLVLAGLGAAGVGVGTAVMLLKRSYE